MWRASSAGLPAVASRAPFALRTRCAFARCRPATQGAGAPRLVAIRLGVVPPQAGERLRGELLLVHPSTSIRSTVHMLPSRSGKLEARSLRTAAALISV